jgi:hypothetical protein
VTTEADLALARLARRYSVTKREMLERLVVRADAAICAGSIRSQQNGRPTSRFHSSPERYRVTDRCPR